MAKKTARKAPAPRVNKPAPQAETPPKEAATSVPAAKLRPVEIPPSLSVRQLSELLQVSPLDIIKQLMRKGIMANINQAINYEAAASLATAYGYEAKLLKPRLAQKIAEARKAKAPTGKEGNLQPRPPVVTVMGHVDHGKTRTLDAIRQTNIMAGEAGGITQHIGAYQTTIGNQKITFLDTPGHEAFTAMRAHGAQITDIIILVVAADDGVMPQTLEAINHAKAAGVPIVVALNKIDKPEANTDLVKQQLAEAGVVCEDWGGDAVCVPISAKEKTGIKELLENLLVVAEVADLKADPTGLAKGVIVEAKMDKSRGPVATALVQSGTLKPGDSIVVGGTWGKVRAMFNDLGKQMKKAEPSAPVEILGLNGVPEVGDTLVAVANEREAQALIEKRKTELREKAGAAKALSLDTLYHQISAGQVQELNAILKTDVQGSIEPIRVSLERLGTEQVKVHIIHSGTGNVTESDVLLAIASKGLIIGFSVGVDEGARRLASQEGIDIRRYDIIYSLIDDVDKALKGLLAPTYVEVIDGRAEVRAVFPAGKGHKAAGVMVTEGRLTRGAAVRVRRAGKVVVESTINSLRRFKEDVREVATGYEGGVSVEGFNDFQVGDVVESYSKQRTS